METMTSPVNNVRNFEDNFSFNLKNSSRDVID